jgi:hypothetical protein
MSAIAAAVIKLTARPVRDSDRFPKALPSATNVGPPDHEPYRQIARHSLDQIGIMPREQPFYHLAEYNA